MTISKNFYHLKIIVMKTILLYFMSVGFLFLFTCCSNEEYEPKSDPVIPETKTPYISPQMEEILNMLDTCTTAIPFEKLVPAANDGMVALLRNSTSSEIPEMLTTRADVEALTHIGATYMTCLYALQQTTFTEQQLANFNFSTHIKTWYVSCYAIEWSFQETRSVVRRPILNENIGIDPNDLAQRGFAISDVIPGVIRKFTTYVYAITQSGDPSNYIYQETIPRRYGGSTNYYLEVPEPRIWYNIMEWNYWAH